MLQSLFIKNYILIEELSIHFDKNFSVITGETGAGKSILLGALDLLLGKRVDGTVRQKKENPCILEATFANPSSILITVLRDLEIEIKKSENILIRRMILENGKSRAFINDFPITQSQLKMIAPFLLEIHSQNQNQQLKEPTYQLNLIDQSAEIKSELKVYQEVFRRYEKNKKNLKNQEQSYQSKLEKRDFYIFQLEKFEILDLENLDLNALEKAHDNIQNQALIESSMVEIMPFFEGDLSIGSQLDKLHFAYKNLSKKLPEAEKMHEQIVDIKENFDSISIEQQNLLENLESHREDSESIEKKMAAVYQLFETFRVQKTEALVEKRASLIQEIESIEALGNEIKIAQKNLVNQTKELEYLAQKLSEQRAKKIPFIESEVIQKLKNLGLEKAVFKIEQKKCSELRISGPDEITFCFSANPETPLKPLGQVASGGEIARISLVMKMLHKEVHQTLIFDEIDTGVSGRMAEKMGQMMREISRNRSVISITHLPQIAALGEAHFEVQKLEKDQKHITQIKKLNPSEKIDAIAKLLSGEKTTKNAREQAKNLLHAK